MSWRKYDVGLSHVGAYQVSARPYFTSSLTIPASGSTPLNVDFDSVTKFIVVTNTLSGGSQNVPMRVGFSENGVKGTSSNNYIILNNGESFEADFKVVDIFLMSDDANQCSASVVAGLTAIEREKLYQNWTGSAGVG
jgi:hypothetical protein